MANRSGFPISVSAAMQSQLLFGSFFAGKSWLRWVATIKAAFAEAMTPEEQSLFREISDRDPPSERVREFVICAGRGGGKDSVASLITTMAAINFAGKLRPGERAVCMCLAVDRTQAKILLGYVRAYFAAIPALAALVVSSNRNSISLSTTSILKFIRAITARCAADPCFALFLTNLRSGPTKPQQIPTSRSPWRWRRVSHQGQHARHDLLGPPPCRIALQPLVTLLRQR